MEREAEAWIRTRHIFAVQTSMSTDEYSYSGSRGYQQNSFVDNGSHFCPSKEAGITQACCIDRGRTVQLQANQGAQRTGGMYCSSGRDVYSGSTRHAYSGLDSQPVGHFKYHYFVNVSIFILLLTPPAVSMDPLFLMFGMVPYPMTLQVVMLCYILIPDMQSCVRRFLLISKLYDPPVSTYFSTMEKREASTATSIKGAVLGIPTKEDTALSDFLAIMINLVGVPFVMFHIDQ